MPEPADELDSITRFMNIPRRPQIRESCPSGNRSERSASVKACLGVAGTERMVFPFDCCGATSESSTGQVKVALVRTISPASGLSTTGATSSRVRYFSIRLHETNPCNAWMKVSGRALRAYSSSAKTAIAVKAMEGVSRCPPTRVKCYRMSYLPNVGQSRSSPRTRRR